ncbi:MAG: glycerophosphodiester phosphodiesterase [Lentisphaeria bacterium]|nr:glycerophosphodiester phosphodiesterase [Lentisphaeria bacterium]
MTAMNAASPAETTFLSNGVTAHRGDSVACPENTMAAFRAAIDAGADWMELDVLTSADGRVVVSHDGTTGRTGDREVIIAQVPYDEIRSVDVAHAFRVRHRLTTAECPPARVPLLSEVLCLAMTQFRTRVSVQPKVDCVDRVVGILRDLGAGRWVGFNDGSPAKMRQAKAHDASFPIFWDRPAHSDIADDIRVALQEGFHSLVINDAGMTQAKVDAVHAAGLDVGAWTINAPVRMAALLDMGVDRIYTDDPRRLLRLLNDRGPRSLPTPPPRLPGSPRVSRA